MKFVFLLLSSLFVSSADSKTDSLRTKSASQIKPTSRAIDLVFRS